MRAGTRDLWCLSPEAYSGKIPFIVTDLISELRRRHAEKVEGIFRLNGSDIKIKELTEALSHGPISNWENYDVHCISTALKRYFRDMSEHEPLIPHDLYDCVIATMSVKEEGRYAVLLKKIINSISPPRQLTLAYLCKFCAEITENSSENKMSPKNLSICIGPNIIVSHDEDDANAMKNSSLANNAFEIMISHFNEIFGDIALDDSVICEDEDLEPLLAPTLNTVNVNHFVVRNKYRQGSLIPYVPVCRISNSPEFKRPSFQPPPLEDEPEKSQ